MLFALHFVPKHNFGLILTVNWENKEQSVLEGTLETRRRGSSGKDPTKEVKDGEFLEHFPEFKRGATENKIPWSPVTESLKT